MKSSNVDGTVKANNLSSTQDAMKWEEIRAVRQIHDEWKRVSQKDQRYDSCFYHYNEVERFTPLPIPQEMTDEQLNEALWREPTAVHNAYNDWFDHSNPKGYVPMNIDAERNDSNHQVSIQLYNPGYARLKTMDYNDEQEFINRVGRNLAKNKRITETATGAKRPTPRYRFLATNIKEPIPWNYLIKGENSDTIQLNPEVQKPRYVSAFTEHHRQQFPYPRPTSAMTAPLDRKTPLALIGLTEDQRQQDTGSPSEDQQRPGSSASASGHLDTTRKDSASSGSRRLPVPSTMTVEEFDAEEIAAKKKQQNYQNRKLLEKQKRELEAVKKQNAEILQRQQQLPPPMKVVTNTSESDGGSSYDTPNSRTPTKWSPATVTRVQEPPTKVNNYRGSSEYVTAALDNIQYDDPEAVKTAQKALVKRHQRDVTELESRIRLAEENLRSAQEHSAQVEAQMAMLELSEQDRRNETTRIQQMERDLNARKKANDDKKKEEIATRGGFSKESAAEDKVLEAIDTTLLGDQALHTESVKVTKSARAKLEAEQRNHTATMGDIEQQLHGLRSDLQAARDEVTEAQTDLAKMQSLQEASQQAASTSQLQQPLMTPRQAPPRPVINTAFDKAYYEQCQYNATRPDRHEVERGAGAISRTTQRRQSPVTDMEVRQRNPPGFPVPDPGLQRVATDAMSLGPHHTSRENISSPLSAFSQCAASATMAPLADTRTKSLVQQNQQSQQPGSSNSEQSTVSIHQPDPPQISNRPPQLQEPTATRGLHYAPSTASQSSQGADAAALLQRYREVNRKVDEALRQHQVNQQAANNYIAALEQVANAQETIAATAVETVIQLALTQPELILSQIQDRDALMARWLTLYNLDDNAGAVSAEDALQQYLMGTQLDQALNAAAYSSSQQRVDNAVKKRLTSTVAERTRKINPAQLEGIEQLRRTYTTADEDATVISVALPRMPAVRNTSQATQPSASVNVTLPQQTLQQPQPMQHLQPPTVDSTQQPSTDDRPPTPQRMVSIDSTGQHNVSSGMDVMTASSASNKTQDMPSEDSSDKNIDVDEQQGEPVLLTLAAAPAIPPANVSEGSDSRTTTPGGPPPAEFIQQHCEVRLDESQAFLNIISNLWNEKQRWSEVSTRAEVARKTKYDEINKLTAHIDDLKKLPKGKRDESALEVAYSDMAAFKHEAQQLAERIKTAKGYHQLLTQQEANRIRAEAVRQDEIDHIYAKQLLSPPSDFQVIQNEQEDILTPKVQNGAQTLQQPPKPQQQMNELTPKVQPQPPQQQKPPPQQPQQQPPRVQQNAQPQQAPLQHQQQNAQPPQAPLQHQPIPQQYRPLDLTTIMDLQNPNDQAYPAGPQDVCRAWRVKPGEQQMIRRPVIAESGYDHRAGTTSQYGLRLDVYFTQMTTTVQPETNFTMSKNMRKCLRLMIYAKADEDICASLEHLLTRIRQREPELRALIRQRSYPNIGPEDYAYLMFYLGSELKLEVANSKRCVFRQYHNPGRAIMILAGLGRYYKHVSDRTTRGDANERLEYQRLLRHLNATVREQDNWMVMQVARSHQTIALMLDDQARHQALLDLAPGLNQLQRYYDNLKVFIVQSINTARHEIPDEDPRQGK